MCQYGSYRVVFQHKYGKKMIVDACIADRVHEMEERGIQNGTPVCGHGKFRGCTTVSPQFIPLLDQYGYEWIWPKDKDFSNDTVSSEQTKAWFVQRTDIVLVYFDLVEKTWNDDDIPEIPQEVVDLWREWHEERPQNKLSPTQKRVLGIE